MTNSAQVEFITVRRWFWAIIHALGV